MNSRERVAACLRFETPDFLPRHIWTVPWSVERYGKELEEIRRRFPEDICWADDVYELRPEERGDPYAVGTYTDEWGCTFDNFHEGIIGEVREPLIKEIDEVSSFRPPFDVLPHDESAARERVNRFCAESDQFVLAGCGPRPWERYQFLRGTENALMDLLLEPESAKELLKTIHDFYLREVEFWASTDVDGIFFQDDWGSQQALLIQPEMWRDLFKPLYKDYVVIAHAHGKFALMHSDGNISSIYEDLVEIGVDAVNSQLACMDLADLAARVKGRITFWGEIDRQNVLTSSDPEVGRSAVRKIARHLYDPAGGVIAQLSFDLGVVPETVEAVFDQWDIESKKNTESMTLKERVMAAINHEAPDRVPRGELAIEEDLLRKLIGEHRFASLDANERLLAAIQELGGDLVNVHQFPMEQVGQTSMGPVFRSVLGDEHVITKGSSQLHKRAIDDISQAGDYQAPDPSSCLTGNLDWFVANSDLFVFAQVMGPVSSLDWMLGTEDYLVWAMTDTDAIRSVTEKVIDYEIARACKFVDHDADAIFITDDIAFNSGLFLPPHIMDELAWPFYRQMISEIKARKDVPVFLHTDGDIRAALDKIVACGFDGLQSLQPSAGMDIVDVKRRYGDKICLMGNMDLDHLMTFGTPEEVAEQAAWLCEHIGSNGGFILSTCNILTNSVPEENARAMYGAGVGV